MTLKNILFLLFFSLVFIACSSDDDNPAESTSSPLNGKWSMEASSSGGGMDYDITTSLDLNFDGSKVTGSGTTHYTITQNSQTNSLTIQNDIAGTYNDPNINLSVTDATTGYIFNYIGSWETKNENFKGTVKVKVGDTEYTLENMFLFKESD